MRIKSVTLRNYRTHKDLVVDFDPARTLIGGRNEVGKSTLVEAIHRSLFLKAKGNTETHRAMQSSIHPGHPEVELVFEAGGLEYQIKKRFGGTGTTTLASSNAKTLVGDDAEEALAKLLSVEGGVSGKAMLSQWAHLWVWQGQAGDDPSTHATAQQNALLQRLQGQGVASALQSDLDAKVASYFGEAAGAIYTQAGKARAGSELELAESASKKAEEEKVRMDDHLQKLESAVSEVETANRDLPQVEASLEKLATAQADLEARAAELSSLRQQETEHAYLAKAADDHHKTLQAADTKIRKTSSDILQLEEDIAPKQTRISSLEQALESAKQAAASAEKAYLEAADEVRQARLRSDLATSCRRSFETLEQQAKLLEKQEKVKKHQGDLTKAETQLAQLPQVTTITLKKLREMESAWTAARSALQAMAAGVEVLTSGQQVVVGDQPLGQGQKLILTEDSELFIGGNTRLRITPGGGTTLSESRQAEADARENLQKQLDSFGLKSLQEASDAFAQCEDIKGQINSIKAALDGLDAESLNHEISEAHKKWTAAKADAERLAQHAADMPLPINKVESEALEMDRHRLLTSVENSEADAKNLRDETKSTYADAERLVTRERAAIEGEKQHLSDMKAQIGLLIQTHGEDSLRAQTLSIAKTELEAAITLLSATKNAITNLQPELLPSDIARMKRAITEKTSERNDLRTRLAGARVSLQSNGSEDPRSALAIAEVKEQSTREYRDSVQRKSQALALLDTLFREEQRALAEQFTQPLVEKISSYLQCLYGPSARPQVTLKDSQFTDLGLYRPAAGGGTFTFDALSGGAKEQVAAAVRLAMAEVLASDHDGCLPVVFDDAFAYSDPERVNQLQRMLDLAATRGLQIIVFTCNPADYSALGARQVIIRPEMTPAAALPILP
jgi:DNA repair exonuclease SbcCD ATPase subunit